MEKTGNIAELLMRACSISTCGAPVSTGTVGTSQNDVGALLTFTGSGISGAVLIGAQRKGLPPSMCKVPLVTDEERTDWLCEIGNRILGALAGLLAADGFDVRMSTPTLVSGRAIQLERGRHALPLRCTIQDPKGPVTVALTVDGELDLRIGSSAAAEESHTPAEVMFLS